MKKLIVGFIVISCLNIACRQIISGGVRGEGAIEKETRNVSGFKAIDFMASGDVYVKRGNSFSVIVETHKNIAELLEIDVSGDLLKIRFKNDIGNINYDKLNIYIEAPSIESLNLSGSGNITAENALTEGSLTADVSGSGNITVQEGIYTKVSSNIGGSGNVTIKGSAESANLNVQGSGNINCEELKSKMVEAHVLGSGNINCFAETDLDATITGSGDITYKGTPTVKSKVTGSGSVEKR
jgi:hypothetical protein